MLDAVKDHHEFVICTLGNPRNVLLDRTHLASYYHNKKKTLGYFSVRGPVIKEAL